MTDTINTGNIKLIRENEDGSADYQCNFPPEALDALTRLGILTAIQAGIEDAKRLNPEEPVNLKFTNEIKDLAEEAGFVFWADETWKPKGATVDWSCAYDDELVKFYHLVKAKYDRQD
jgi:hypothetical protein